MAVNVSLHSTSALMAQNC